MQDKMNLAEYEKEREEKLQKSTPMAESFEQAAELAAEVVAAAREDGVMAQAIYCSSQGDEDEESLLEEAVDLVEQMAHFLAEQGSVRILFPDAGTAGAAADEWDALPSGVSVRPMPEADDIRASSSAGLLDASFVLLVAPTQAQRRSVDLLLEMAAERGAVEGEGTAVVAVNAGFEEELPGATRTFHFEQVDMVDADGEPYNTAIVTRAYPQAFTIWEDNPEDPDAKDGIYFVDIVEDEEELDRPPTEKELLSLLEASRRLFKERCKWK